MKIALVGNPNTGKSSLFNVLTGLNQKIGNYPGVTVDKKVGYFKLPNGSKVELIDLPGTYSLNASSKDEEIVTEALTDPSFSDYPDAVIVVVDASNLKRNLLLFTQVIDLEIPVIFALNMIDVSERRGFEIDEKGLEKEFGIPVIKISARKGIGIDQLKLRLQEPFVISPVQIFDPTADFAAFVADAETVLHRKNSYSAWLIANTKDFALIPEEQEKALGSSSTKKQYCSAALQSEGNRCSLPVYR